jgi:hypothetical protein
MSGQNADELELMLNGAHYRLSSPLQFTNLKTFPGKVVTGDYSLDSNPLLSAWVISDYSGGHGVQDINEATDTNRYSYGDINTRFPKQFTLPFQYKYGQFGLTGNSYCPVGNMYISGNFKYITFLGNDLRIDDVSAGAAAATATPTRHGVAFQGTYTNEVMYVPRPADAGYITYDPSTNTLTSNATPKMRDFCVWDNKLVGVDSVGQLWWITAALGVWAKFDTAGLGRDKLPDGAGGRSLCVYVNAAGDPTLHVLGYTGVWAFDAGGPKLWKTKIDIPPHPAIWSGFCVWRGDLYIAVGMDVIQWNGSVQRNLGLSRDDGIPYAYQGFILDLQPELNGLFALVQGMDSTWAFNGNISVHEWSGYGWRALPMPKQGLHKAPCLIGLMNSDALGYKLLLGTKGWNATSPNRVEWYLPRAFTNPRASLEAGVIPFGATGQAPFITTDNGNAYFETGRYDANMQGYTKIANALEVTFADNSTSNQAAEFYYRTEANSSYTLLGTAPNSAPGRYAFPFGTANSDGTYPGLPFQFIELKVILYGGASVFTTPVLQNMVLSFEKVVASSYSWVANISLQGNHKGRSPQTILDELKALASQSGWFGMVHRGTTYRVQISQMDGAENLANDERAIARISLLQIPASISASAT